MKMKAVLILLGLSVSVFAQEYWIQVLNVKESVPLSFIQKVQRSGQEYKVLDTSSGHKVWLGSYENHLKAEKVLNLIRCSIASDAFIVQEEAAQPLVEQVPEKLAVIAGVKPVASSSKPIKRQPDVTKKVEKVEAEKSEPCICICDKQALRKSEIGNAMAFYRNSPDYQFTGKDEIVPGF